jgi:Ni,Fe-hydrogenase maturation factor
VVVVDCLVVVVEAGTVVVVDCLVVVVEAGTVVVVDCLVVVVEAGTVVVVDKGIQSEGELHTDPAFEHPVEQCSILVPLQVQAVVYPNNQFHKSESPPVVVCG